MTPPAGTLFIVATPIGNLEDISARALRILGDVRLIAAEDTRRTGQLLSRYAIATPMTSLHEHNEQAKASFLIQRLLNGENIALVSDAGTPTVSDPGQRLVRAAVAANVRVESVPGPSAVLAALAASGFPSQSFTFLGFPPSRGKDRTAWFNRLAGTTGTVVFFEAPHRIRVTLEALRAVVGDCEVVACRELTKAHEELVRGPISEVVAGLQEPRGEFTVVINIGETTEFDEAAPATDAELAAEFGLITETSAVGRREAVQLVARRHGRPTKDVYSAIERARKSGLIDQ